MLKTNQVQVITLIQSLTGETEELHISDSVVIHDFACCDHP